MAEKVDAGLEKLEQEQRDDVKYARDTRTYLRTEAAAVRADAAAARADEIAQLTAKVDTAKKQLEMLQANFALAGAETSIHLAAEQARADAEVKELQSRIAKLKAANELASLSAGT
jgi:uncharacterized protein YacL (UPF0231 family)